MQGEVCSEVGGCFPSLGLDVCVSLSPFTRPSAHSFIQITHAHFLRLPLGCSLGWAVLRMVRWFLWHSSPAQGSDTHAHDLNHIPGRWVPQRKRHRVDREGEGARGGRERPAGVEGAWERWVPLGGPRGPEGGSGVMIRPRCHSTRLSRPVPGGAGTAWTVPRGCPV